MIHFGLARKDESLEEKELWSPKLFLLLEENQKLVAPGAMRGPRFRIKAMLRIRLNGEIKKKLVRVLDDTTELGNQRTLNFYHYWASGSKS